jgi:hypothetical protein
MDALADCLTVLNFWNVIGGPQNEMVAKREVARYLDVDRSKYGAHKDALDKLAAAWVQHVKPTDPTTVTEYLLHLVRTVASKQAAS